MHGLVPTEVNLFFRKEKKKLYPLISYSCTTISSLLSSRYLKFKILDFSHDIARKQANDQLCNLGRLHDKLSFYFILVFILRRCRTSGWRIGAWIIFLDQGSKLIIQDNLHAHTFLITVSCMAILTLKNTDKRNHTCAQVKETHYLNSYLCRQLTVWYLTVQKLFPSREVLLSPLLRMISVCSK